MEQILVSVIMCVYNTNAVYLNEAIKSILEQSFSKFEFIIVDDGSDAFVNEVLSRFSDSRIKIIKNCKNIGLTKSLNIALKAAKGKYIARMDADDLSFRQRFQIQFDYMEKHPDIVVCGTLAYKTGSKSCIGFSSSHNQEVFKVKLLMDNAGPVHPTVFIRKRILEENNISYNEAMLKAQDYDLWCKCVLYGKIKVIPKILLIYRTHGEQASNAQKEKQLRCNLDIRLNQLKAYQMNFTDEEIKVFKHLKDYNMKVTLRSYYNFLQKLLKANKAFSIYQQFILERELFMYWLITGRKYKEAGNSIFQYRWTYQGLLNPVFTLYILYEKWFMRLYNKIFGFFALNKSRKEIKNLYKD